MIVRSHKTSKSITVFLGFLLGIFGQSLAQDTKFDTSKRRFLKSEDLRIELTDQTLRGSYPLSFDDEEVVYFSETYHGEGHLSYKDNDLTDEGRWWIDADNICHSYDVDDHKINHCFYVYEQSKCYYFHESLYFRTGERRIAHNWNSKAIIMGQGGSCDTLVS